MPSLLALHLRRSPHLFVTLLAISQSTGAAAGQVCVPPPSGILAWWPLDETSGTIAQDIVGSHAAVHFGAPTPSPGQVGGALRFGGADFLGAADSDLWAFGKRSFSIELWANFDTPGGGTLHHPSHIFIGNDETAGNWNKWFFALGEGFLNFHINSPTLGPKFFPLAPFSPEVGKWYHLAATRNGNLYTLFVDGRPVGSIVHEDSIPDPDASLTIGQAESLGFVHGRLDEITVYGRALTEAEVEAIATAGYAGKCKDASSTAGSIVPSTGGDTGFVTVRIIGKGFTDASTVKLAREGSTDILGSLVQVADSLTLSTTFDLAGQPQGSWDVVIANPDGTSFSLPQSFTIVAGQAPQVWVDIIGRGAIRAGRPERFYLIYGNLGGIDAIGIPVWIKGIPREADLRLNFTILPPPPLPEQQEPVDWNQIPIRFQTEQSDTIALLIPRIPSGAIGVLPIDLTVPATTQKMTLDTWVNSSLFDPHMLSEGDQPIENLPAAAELLTTTSSASIGIEIADCFKEIGMTTTHHLRPGLACALTFFDHATKALGDRIYHAGTFSWSHLFLDLAIYCTGSGVPISTTQAISFKWLVASIHAAKIWRECREVLRERSKASRPTNVVTSIDPNVKIGSAGSGELKALSGREPLRYAIRFENLPSATGPAQEVTITDQLDQAKLDLKTLSLGSITFGDQRVDPSPNLNSFTTTVDLRPTRNLIVRIEASLDSNSGLITWRFTSIDPETGTLPKDPFVGFLPPNAVPPEGEGSIFFTVMPKENLDTGTEIRNSGTITFDTNLPIATQEWVNTLDNTSPVSQVLPLASFQDSLDFEVMWSGSDVGSGIRGYTLIVSENDGPYVTWLADTVATAAIFHGVSGRRYAFYSIANDMVGNLEEVPPVPDSVTQIAILPPIIQSISPNTGATEGGTSVTISGSGFAVGATVQIGGVAATDVEVEDPTSISVKTAAHETGAVDVSVTNPDGRGATLLRSYFFYSSPSEGSDFFTVAPCRVIDTRWVEGPLGGPALAPSEERFFAVIGTCGIPHSAKALAANLTVVSSTSAGHLSVFPGNAFFLGTSTINFSASQTRATNGIMLLATDATGFLGILNSSGGSIHLILDVNGYFE